MKKVFATVLLAAAVALVACDSKGGDKGEDTTKKTEGGEAMKPVDPVVVDTGAGVTKIVDSPKVTK